jgi:hypothetical protein
MRVKGLASVSAVALGGTLLAAGCTSSPPSHPSAPGSPSAARAGTRGGAVRLLDYSGDDGAESTVILTGAIGDYGRALSVTADGKADPEHRGDLRLTLAHGSFRIGVSGLDKKLVSAFSHFPSDTATCSGTVSVSGPAPIVAGSGTGAYRGISGRFTLTATIAEVDATQKCGPSSPFLRQAVINSGPGTVSLP